VKPEGDNGMQEHEYGGIIGAHGVTIHDDMLGKIDILHTYYICWLATIRQTFYLLGQESNLFFSDPVGHS
jgi:hypothetical protein